MLKVSLTDKNTAVNFLRWASNSFNQNKSIYIISLLPGKGWRLQFYLQIVSWGWWKSVDCTRGLHGNMRCLKRRQTLCCLHHVSVLHNNLKLAPAEWVTLGNGGAAGDYEFSICTAHPVSPERFPSCPAFLVHHVWGHSLLVQWHKDLPVTFEWLPVRYD